MILTFLYASPVEHVLFGTPLKLDQLTLFDVASWQGEIPDNGAAVTSRGPAPTLVVAESAATVTQASGETLTVPAGYYEVREG